MFKEMRRKEKMMSRKETVKVLEESSYGCLATIGPNGYPYSVPLNYAYQNGAIYLHSAPQGEKIDNIRFNNKVTFSVVNYIKIIPEKFDTEYDSAVVFGKAYEVDGEREKNEALVLLIKKYSPDCLEQGLEYIAKVKDVAVIKIVIEHMTGKRGR